MPSRRIRSDIGCLEQFSPSPTPATAETRYLKGMFTMLGNMQSILQRSIQIALSALLLASPLAGQTARPQTPVKSHSGLHPQRRSIHRRGLGWQYLCRLCNSIRPRQGRPRHGDLRRPPLRLWLFQLRRHSRFLASAPQRRAGQVRQHPRRSRHRPPRPERHQISTYR